MNLFALILWLLAHLTHSAVDVGEPVPPPAAFVSPAPAPPRPVATPGDRPTTPHYAPPSPAPVQRAPTADDPVCEPDTPADVVCAQGQLPEETIGRAYG